MKLHSMIPFGLILLSSPALAEDTETICTDRPTKGNSACTVPEGMIQIEAEPVFWTRQGDQEATIWGGFGLKYGVTDSTDVQLFVSPMVDVRDPSTGLRERGFGDAVVRIKQRITPVGAPIQIAALPYVKVPTAGNNLGNGKIEGGLLVPINFSLGSVGINVVPTLDVLADADQQGHHLQFTGVVAATVPLTDRLSIAGELWTAQNWEPAGTIQQYSADAAITYLLSNDVQLDAGANFGLNAQTPDVQIYTGISFRF